MDVVVLIGFLSVGFAWCFGWYRFERRQRDREAIEITNRALRHVREEYERTYCRHPDAAQVWSQQSLSEPEGPPEMLSRWCPDCETQLPPLSRLEQEFDIVPAREAIFTLPPVPSAEDLKKYGDAAGRTLSEAIYDRPSRSFSRVDGGVITPDC